MVMSHIVSRIIGGIESGIRIAFKSKTGVVVYRCQPIVAAPFRA